MRYYLLLAGLFLFIPLLGQTYFFENFESTADSSLPAGWSQITTASDGGFKTGTELSHSSFYFRFEGGTGRFPATNDDRCNCDKQNELLMTPVIPLDTQLTGLFLSADTYFYSYSDSGKSERASVEISTDSGKTWQKLKELEGTGGIRKWVPIYINLGEYMNSSSIMIGFRYSDGGLWSYGFAVDNVRLYIPPANAVELSGFKLPEYAAIGDIILNATITNWGRDTLRSVRAEYSVDGGNSVSSVVSGFNIAPLASAEITHPTPWQPSVSGEYSVTFSVSEPNGSNDSSSVNKILTDSIMIASRMIDRVTLVEEFTSSTSTPGALYNMALIPLLQDEFRANTRNSRVAALVYHLNIPDPGNDPSFNADVAGRAAQYDAITTPLLYADGNRFFFDPDKVIQKATEQKAPVQVEIESVFLNDSLVTTVTVTPFIPKPAGLKLFVALSEDYCEYTGYNEEVDFIYVMRKLLPDASGETLPELIPNQPITYRYAFKVVAGNVTQGSYNFWNPDMYYYTSIAWVQEMSGRKEVFQAAFDESVVVGNQPTKEQVRARLFPNPVKGLLYVVADLSSERAIKCSVFNMTGQMVHSQKADYSGNQFLQFDLSHLPSGVYLVELTDGEQAVRSKISINH